MYEMHINGVRVVTSDDSKELVDSLMVRLVNISLIQHNGNQVKAAKSLGINRNTLAKYRAKIKGRLNDIQLTERIRQMNKLSKGTQP